MRKLAWLGSILLTLVACTTSISHAQNVVYEYDGPLDKLQTVPLNDAITSRPTDRVASLKLAKKLRSAHPSMSGRITGVSVLPPSRQTTGRITRQDFSPPPPTPTRAIREPFSRNVPTPAFIGPLTESTGSPPKTNYIPRQNQPTQFGHSGPLTDPRTPPAATNYSPRQNQPTQFGHSGPLTDSRIPPTATSYIPRQNQPTQFGHSEAFNAPTSRSIETDYVPTQGNSTQFGYTGALTDSEGQPVEIGYIPSQEDPTRFGYHDGKAFGFDNTRLFNPLEGPQLDLQGAPTADFGEPGCDEWANFSRIRDLEYNTPCGGLKAKPGHLGIPWLGSEDACDQTIPLRKKRRLSGRRDQAEEVCETCGSCPTCGR